MRMNGNLSKLTVLILVWAFVLGLTVGPQPAAGLDLGGTLGDLLKVFGVGWVVNRFAGDIDDAINNLLGQRDARIAGATKVVPILRIAEGGNYAIGAAQVMGPNQQVTQVNAVGEFELSVGELRGRALLPVSTTSGVIPKRGIDGVGISANVKFPI